MLNLICLSKVFSQRLCQDYVRICQRVPFSGDRSILYRQASGDPPLARLRVAQTATSSTKKLNRHILLRLPEIRCKC